MPYLRFARDPRGYESTSVLHTFRRRGATRPRILYWFRTPPNVKVGRAALDEEAIREIEKHHPDLEFDWTKILETQATATPAPRRTERRPSRSTGRRQGTPRAGGRGLEPEAVPAPVEIAPDEVAISREVDVPHVTAPFVEAAEPPPDRLDVDEIVPDEPASLAEWESLDQDGETVPHVGAVEALVGAEGLARLRVRHAEIQARITERGGDPAEVVELRRRAEALDPDTWVTKDEAQLALEHYEARLEEFRRLLGPRRRRSRRGGRRRSGRGQRSASGGAFRRSRPMRRSLAPKGPSRPTFRSPTKADRFQPGAIIRS